MQDLALFQPYKTTPHKKILLGLIITLVVSFNAFAHWGMAKPTKRQGISFNRLEAYNLVMTSHKDGIYTYTGSSNGLELSFSATEAAISPVQFFDHNHLNSSNLSRSNRLLEFKISGAPLR